MSEHEHADITVPPDDEQQREEVATDTLVDI